MKNRLSLSLGLAMVALFGAVAIQGLKVRDMKEGDRKSEAHDMKLEERLPKSLAGWSGRDEPLGPNEVTRTAVERTLNYDDYVYRIYEDSSRQVGVYVAYWGAGRMPLQKVASHTPDRCWTENGWKCDEMRFAENIVSRSLRLRPAQWRRFTPPNGAAQQYVVYWHLVGDELYDYGNRFNARPDFRLWWRDTLKYAFSGSAPQYFIRVTSNRPFDELSRDRIWGELVSLLGSLGLSEQPVSPARK